MNWVGRIALAVLSLFVLARAAVAQPVYAAPSGYVKVSNPQDYLPGYPEGGIPIPMDGYAGGYASQPGDYPQGYASGYPVGYPAGAVVVVEETCCRGRAPAPTPYPPDYGYGQPIMQIVETGPCCARPGGDAPGYGRPCCAPPPACDPHRPSDPRDPYACPPGWGLVTLKDSFFAGGGGVGPEYIAGGGGGGGGYVIAGAGARAFAYAGASASVRVGYGGGKRGHHPGKPRGGGGGKCGCK
jgi:hypothetical protein